MTILKRAPSLAQKPSPSLTQPLRVMTCADRRQIEAIDRMAVQQVAGIAGIFNQRGKIWEGQHRMVARVLHADLHQLVAVDRVVYGSADFRVVKGHLEIVEAQRYRPPVQIPVGRFRTAPLLPISIET